MSLSLNYRKSGEGPPLLILHGVFGSGENWLTVSKQFMPHFEVFLIDQRNHGRSPHSDSFSYELLVEDLRQFADEQGLKSFFIIGHSMGGKVAMKFAARYPQRLEKLVVVDIAPRYYAPHHQEVLKALRAVDLENTKSRQEAEAAMAPYIPEADTRQFLLKNLYRKEDGQFAWRIHLDVLEREIANIGEALQVNQPITVPTLFVKGERSRYISEQDVNQIHELFTQAKVETIANAGHWVQAEQPQAFADLVLGFLQKP